MEWLGIKYKIILPMLIIVQSFLSTKVCYKSSSLLNIESKRLFVQDLLIREYVCREYFSNPI
jgi:hypothetical protein